MTRPLGAVRTSATHWSILVWTRAILSTGRRRRGFVAAEAALQGRGARALCQCTFFRAGLITRGTRNGLQLITTLLRAASPRLPTTIWVSVTPTVSVPGSPASLQRRSLGALDNHLFWGRVAALASCWRKLGPSGQASIQRRWDSLMQNLASWGTPRKLRVYSTLKSWKPLLGSISTANDPGSTLTFSIGVEKPPPLTGSNRN